MLPGLAHALRARAGREQERMLANDLLWPLPGHLLGSSRDRDRDTELSEVAAHSLGAPMRRALGEGHPRNQTSAEVPGLWT